jgi:hypothetical protein
VYEVRQCLPRVFTAGSCEIVAGQGRLKEYLRANSVKILRERVVYNREDLSPADTALLMILRKADGAKDKQEDEENLAPHVTSYSDNKIIINVTAPSPRQLVLNENYFRDWTASVNGRLARILPAYGVFRSVILEKGENRVVFEYRPAYLVTALRISGWGSIIFLAACLGWAFAGKREGEN